MLSVARAVTYYGFPSLMTVLLAPYAFKSEESLNQVLAREPTPFEVLLEERSITNELFINVLCMAGLWLSSERAPRMAFSLIGAVHMLYLSTIPPRVVQFDFSDPDGPAPTNIKITRFMVLIYFSRFLLVVIEPKGTGKGKKSQ